MRAGIGGKCVPDFTICKCGPLQKGKHDSIERQTWCLIENMR